MNTERYEICGRHIKECVCGAECGHICSLDYGEIFCHVCLPEQGTVDDSSG